MKTFFTFVLLFVSFACLRAGDDKFTKAMEKNIASIDTLKSLAAFQEVANNFERIANAEKSKWQPYYYSAYCQAICSFIDTAKGKKDIYLDKAENLISMADSLKPDNSEIFTLKGMIAQGRMAIDPMARWQKYGALSTNNLQKAKELDPENPRPDFLIGQSLLYTPEAFGGGKKTALPVLNESLEKFKKFRPEDSIAPNWGQKMLEGLLEKLKDQ